MAFSDIPVTPLATWQARYTAAQAAFDALMSGQAVVEIVADGYTTRYRVADADKLKAYIGYLADQIAHYGQERRMRGIGVVF